MNGPEAVDRHPTVAAAAASMSTEVLSAVASKLGLSVDALRLQLSSGRPLSTVAAVAGLAHSELVDTIAAARRVPMQLVSNDGGGGVLL